MVRGIAARHGRNGLERPRLRGRGCPFNKTGTDMQNKRFKQADREALITLGVYGFFFLWWTLFAFGLGSGDPEQYTYVLGMPAWFFYSCVLGYPVVSVLLWIVIKRTFTDMPLDASTNDPAGETGGAGQHAPGSGPETAARPKEGL